MQLQSGQQLYKYHLKRRIGVGNFSQVWLAEDQSVGCEYAIKILKPEVRISDFRREAYAGHKLNHDNVMRVHYADFVKDSTKSYPIIVMDYMSKGTIIQLANPLLFLELPEVIKLGRDILNGLDHLHGLNLIHRDVKPGNVLIGPREQGVISDYSIVEPTQNGLSRAQAPMYMYVLHTAPEVLKSKPVTVQTDVFQVDLTLFRILVGLDWLKQKFNRLGREAYFTAIIDGDLIVKTDFPAYVPNRLRQIILKAIHPDLTKRFSSALVMRRELEKLSYPGYWTTTDNRDPVGYNGNFTYSFEKKEISKTRYDVVARRCHTISKRTTRCRKFCHLNLTNSIAEKEISEFIKAVVEGI